MRKRSLMGRAGTMVERDYIAEAITDYLGERCPDFVGGCHTCLAWRQYDRLRSELAACREALEKIEDVDFECYSISELHEYVTDLARAALGRPSSRTGKSDGTR